MAHLVRSRDEVWLAPSVSYVAGRENPACDIYALSRVLSQRNVLT